VLVLLRTEMKRFLSALALRRRVLMVSVIETKTIVRFGKQNQWNWLNCQCWAIGKGKRMNNINPFFYSFSTPSSFEVKSPKPYSTPAKLK